MGNNKKQDFAQTPSPATRERVGEREDDPLILHRNSTYRARDLRQSQTDTEKMFWNRVKVKQFHGYKFKRQFPVGIYTVDFVCIERKIVVEIDGGQHCENKKDGIRTKYFRNKGYEVVRFWNNEVLGNIDGVLHSLSLTLSIEGPENGPQ